MTATTFGRLRLIRRFRLRNVEFPVADFVLPTRLQGYENGKVPDEMLVGWTDYRGRKCRMAPEFLRAWVALVWLAKLHTGRDLTFTSPADVYRTFPQQEGGWKRRMTLIQLPGRPSRLCGYPDGVPRRWWLLPFMAGIACPGHSNHGWFGAAIDHTTDRGRTVAWLQWASVWFPQLGYSWEAPSEDWHVRYCLGDAIPELLAQIEYAQSRPVLGQGAAGPDVVLVQRAVRAKPDGQWGPKTTAAVLTWKQAQLATYVGLEFGPTWNAQCWLLAYPAVA